jgi:hypothetical protein
MSECTEIVITATGHVNTINELEENNFSFQYIRPEPNIDEIDNVYGNLFHFHKISVEKLKMFSDIAEEVIANNSHNTELLDEIRRNKPYGWKNAYWGPKEELFGHSLCRLDENTISIKGDSVSEPPLELLRFATERFPDLSIKITYLNYVDLHIKVTHFRNGAIKEEQSIKFEKLESTLRDSSLRQDRPLLQTQDELGFRETIADHLDFLLEEFRDAG